MLLVNPFSLAFFVIYTLCGISDVLDGYIARKTKTTSQFGETLDSISDFIFIVFMLIIFIPILTWERWMFYWIGIIALVRFISLGIGFAKYHTLAFIHTYANKATGIILFFFPFLLFATGLTATAFVMCSIANLSALEELIINIKSRSLNRNEVSMFRSKDKSMQ